MGVAASLLLVSTATAAMVVFAFMPRRHFSWQLSTYKRSCPNECLASEASAGLIRVTSGREEDGEKETDVGNTSTISSPVEPEQPSSKRSIKRKQKEKAIILMWAERKAKEKEERRAKREAALLLQPQLPPTEEELMRVAANRQRRSAKREQHREQFSGHCQTGATVVIDCEWLRASGNIMADREVRSLAQQVLYSYGVNRAAKVPVQLVMTGVDPGCLLDAQLRKVSGYPDSWTGIQITALSLHEFFDCRASLVYLSSEADTVLETLEPEKVYIIGGIVDRNRMKGATKEKADRLGITTARLPIQEHINTGQYSKVLAVNHVFEILVDFQHSQDWKKTLDSCMPGRKKGGTLVEA